MTETNDPTDRGRDGAKGRTAVMILKRALDLFLRRGLKYTVPFLMLAVLLVIRTQFDETIVEPLRLKVFDTYQVIQPREYVDTPVRVLDIDDESLARIGQWPWPRTMLAQMLVNAFNAGAAVVAFDMVFAEPDRTSPTRVAESWLGNEELADIKARIAKLPDHDAVFADVIAQTNVVAGFVLKGEPGGHPPKPK